MGATGTLCFKLRMTLPMGFKTRMDSSSCALPWFVCNYPESHLWLPEPGIEPRSLTCEASTMGSALPGNVM